MSTPLDVVVIGAINADLVATLDRRPAPGETVLGRAFFHRSGGKAANQAVAAARAGASTALIGLVGDDTDGQHQVAALTRARVDITAVGVTRERPTGVALITVTPDGENSIVVVPGANGSLQPSDIPAALDQLAPARVIVGQTEVAPACIDEAARQSRARSTRFILNNAPVVELQPETLAEADPLVVNEHEAAQLAEVAEPVAGIELAQLVCAATGAKSVIVTLGSQGAAVATRTNALLVPAVAAYEVHDTTGAGDAFVGTLAAKLARGANLEQATRIAAGAAAKTVAALGAR